MNSIIFSWLAFLAASRIGIELPHHFGAQDLLSTYVCSGILFIALKSYLQPRRILLRRPKLAANA